jgi:hypothetical protein
VTATITAAPEAIGDSSDALAQVRTERFPYAAAIGLGVLVALWQA